MNFFSKRKQSSKKEENFQKTISEKMNVADIKVATTFIVSSYNDGSGLGPRCINFYFLVREVNEKYYEIFSGKQIEKESDTHNNGFISQNFNTPYIEKLEPLTDYLTNVNESFIDSHLLFSFIVGLNAKETLKAFDEFDETED